MDGLNSSVITGKCSGCTAYRKELKEAREKLAAVKNYSGDLRANRDVLDTVVVARELDRILKGGD